MIYIFQVLWAFSIYLEAVAILPQLVLLQRSGNVDNLTSQYVFFLGYVIHLSHLLLISISLFIWTSHHGLSVAVLSLVLTLLDIPCPM